MMPPVQCWITRRWRRFRPHFSGLLRELAIPPLSLPADEGPGTQIGRYKLLEKIGEGGFGEVYVAEQREPVKRKVALKIIKLGMDTRQSHRPIRGGTSGPGHDGPSQHRQVLDAGATDTGRPYFVMELVRGHAITRYCDENHLTAEERLKSSSSFVTPSSTRTRRGSFTGTSNRRTSW